jgi:hypothetical protein
MNVGEISDNPSNVGAPTGLTENEAVWPFPTEKAEDRERRINATDDDDKAQALHEELGFAVLDADGKKMMFGDKVRAANSDFIGGITNISVLDTGMVRIILCNDKTELMAVDACMTLFVSRPERYIAGIMEPADYEFGDVIQDELTKMKGTIVEINWPESGCITYVCRRKISKKDRKTASKINADLFITQRHAVLVKAYELLENDADTKADTGTKTDADTKADTGTKTDAGTKQPVKADKVPGPPPVRYKADIPQAQLCGHPFNHA